MIKSVILSRLSDGLVFCESNEGYMDQKILTIKHKVRNYHCQVTAYNKSQQTSLKQIENSQFSIFYKINNYVIFTVILDKAYPIKLASGFIDSLISPFFDEAKTILGATNFKSRLQSITSQLYFIKFDRTIKLKKNEFEDPNSIKNVDRMKKQLESIHDIMKQNMSLLEGRQEDLNQTEARAKRINEQSKKFDQGTKKLLWQYWVKKNLIWLVLAVTVVILYFLIF